ncbi:unnamed protein product [Callosobruchus maculatus]|uniref:Uncharacterized protein n=1 Tax=Callosobruchus maculatus TaxID=64391 RepID=A0A653C459_CALMS|nr:unnamed protein product [Callosobruchus maculatus]
MGLYNIKKISPYCLYLILQQTYTSPYLISSTMTEMCVYVCV